MSEEKDAFDLESDRILEEIRKLCSNLRERCDSVIVICTLAEGVDSRMVFDYKGNFYAVMGSLQRFTERIEHERKRRDEAGEN